MQIKRIGMNYLIRLERGEAVVERLHQFAKHYGLRFATVRASGIFQRVTLGHFTAQSASYQRETFDEPVEVLSLRGDIARCEDGQPTLQAQVVVGRSDYSLVGGHLIEAIVGPTLEVFVEPIPVTIHRRHDPDSGLELWELEAIETASV